MPIDPATGEELPYPGEQGGPPAAAPPSGDVEQMDQMMSDDAAARAEAIASAAPMPKSPFSFQAIKSLIDEFNKTIDALGGEDLPEVEFEAPEGEKRWNQPLPPAIFVPVVALLEALKMIDDGGMFDKYGFDPEELVDDTSLRKAAPVKKVPLPMRCLLPLVVWKAMMQCLHQKCSLLLTKKLKC